jgi:transcriptional regulator with XRE-family HTH domain
MRGRIRDARLSHGWSCAELDRQAELSVGHTARIESGVRHRVSAGTLMSIAEALDVTVEWLMGDDNE